MCPFGNWLLVAAALVLAHTSNAQSQWASTEAPGEIIGPLRHIYANDTKDTIYFAGIISLNDSLSWQLTNSVLRYSAGQWDTLGVINGQVQTVVQYRDTLLAGGEYFLSCSGMPCSHVAFWDGSTWRPYGDFGTYGVRMLRVLDGELYAVGAFNEVDGQPASGVAKRVGNGWVPVGTMDSEGLLDIAKYNGNLIVTGNIDFPNGRNIAQWDGNAWSVLGSGIINSMSHGHCLAVYQGDLYVGGQIGLVLPGNPGQNIMRWDGTQFHGLGQGIQWWLGDQSSIATVFEMVEHNGKLFVGGGYRAAGGIEALGLSTWDGLEWCAVPGDFRASGGIWGMDFYHDTLFVACGITLDGDTVNGTAKFIGEDYTTSCSGPVGILESPVTGFARLHPNPACEGTTLFTGDRVGARYDVLGMAGGVVHSDVLGPTGSALIPLQNIVPGVYVVRVYELNGAFTSLKLIRQ